MTGARGRSWGRGRTRCPHRPHQRAGGDLFRLAPCCRAERKAINILYDVIPCSQASPTHRRASAMHGRRLCACATKHRSEWAAGAATST
eukprot:5259277-Prymnesium_polylepis.2